MDRWATACERSGHGWIGGHIRTILHQVRMRQLWQGGNFCFGTGNPIELDPCLSE